jgi:ribosomal protein S18 acetylase RimI-like enzyme
MSDLVPCLPVGYRSRPATVADVPAIHELVAAAERARGDGGRAETDLDRVAADLARPGLDLATDTLLVHDAAGALAGRAWVNRRSEVDVHPAHRGRGLGAALLDWVDDRARRAGTGQVVQTVPDDDTAAVALVTSRGYTPMVTAWLLGIALAGEPAVPEPPAGVTVRHFRPGDERATHRLTEDAFDEWQQRRRSYDEWALLTVGRETFAPGMSPLAFAGGELVGAVLSLDVPDADEGYVERVAVRRDHRNRGVARLLLRHAFRDFHRRGRRGCTLWTHSDTGARALYERVGMTVRRSATVYRKRLETVAAQGL